MKASDLLADALMTKRLVVVLGDASFAYHSEMCFRFEWRRFNGVADTRACVRRCIVAARDAPRATTLLVPLSDVVLRELSVCAMLHDLPALAEAAGYAGSTVPRSAVAVFAAIDGELIHVEGSRHGWRIESEDEEMAKLDALMQDCFAELDGSMSE